jgi:hypothetical protein
MSLSSWSVVFFLAQFVFYMSIYFAMFTPPHLIICYFNLWNVNGTDRFRNDVFP